MVVPQIFAQPSVKARHRKMLTHPRMNSPGSQTSRFTTHPLVAPAMRFARSHLRFLPPHVVWRGSCVVDPRWVKSHSA